jgi:hypothetical protein
VCKLKFVNNEYYDNEKMEQPFEFGSDIKSGSDANHLFILLTAKKLMMNMKRVMYIILL